VRTSRKIGVRIQSNSGATPIVSTTVLLKGTPVLNKTDLIAAIAEDTNLSKADAGRAFDSALEHLSGALVRGETVQLIGFGTFTVASRAERQGRNPSTGEAITIKASKSPKFAAGKALKDAINKAG
jgi:DNA-binding protein HU-beta